MSHRRFFVPPESIRGGIAILPPEQRHHLKDVLRLGPGDAVRIFDGEGHEYTGVVERLGRALVVRSLVEHSMTGADSGAVILALALIKQDRFEWALEKATELGAGEIVPLTTRLCTIRIPEDKLAARVERWKRIMREAARQSERPKVPGIRCPMTLPACLALPECRGVSRLFLDARAGTAEGWALAAGERAAVFVGPEGGWHRDELELAKREGCRIISHASGVLRSETAAVAALSVIEFLRSAGGA